MFVEKSQVGPGVTQVRMQMHTPEFARCARQILDVFYPAHDGRFGVHFNDGLLRQEILEVPLFRDFREEMLELLGSGERAIIIESVHLGECTVVDRNSVLFCIGLALGYPTPSQQRSALILWDVKQRGVPLGQVPTYSEHSREADLHTDSQFFPYPEPWFLLYAVRAARCGGGVSCFCTAEQVIETLSATSDGAYALKILSSRDVPFQFYDPYFSNRMRLDGGVDAQVFFARVIGEGSTIRYRRDVISHGLNTCGGAVDREVQDALREFASCLDQRVRRVSHLLADDALVVCDNLNLLHGRTAFKDSTRHLLRMRMSAEPVVESIGRQRTELCAHGDLTDVLRQRTPAL